MDQDYAHLLLLGGMLIGSPHRIKEINHVEHFKSDALRKHWGTIARYVQKNYKTKNSLTVQDVNSIFVNNAKKLNDENAEHIKTALITLSNHLETTKGKRGPFYPRVYDYVIEGIRIA